MGRKNCTFFGFVLNFRASNLLLPLCLNVMSITKRRPWLTNLSYSVPQPGSAPPATAPSQSSAGQPANSATGQTERWPGKGELLLARNNSNLPRSRAFGEGPLNSDSFRIGKIHPFQPISISGLWVSGGPRHELFDSWLLSAGRNGNTPLSRLHPSSSSRQPLAAL